MPHSLATLRVGIEKRATQVLNGATKGQAGQNSYASDAAVYGLRLGKELKAVLEIARPEDGGHAAARDDVEDLVLVDGLAGGEVSHRATLAAGGSGRQADAGQRPNRHHGRAVGGGQSRMHAI